MTYTQEQVAEMVKRLRDWDISDSDKEVIADMLEQLAAERDALDETCITWSEVSQRNYQRAKAADAEVARKDAALRLWLEYDSTDDDDGVTMMLRYQAALDATRAALQEKPHD